LRISRSLRRTLRRRRHVVTADRAFAAVVDGCAAPRRYTDATWITLDMAAAYKRLHALGWAHSFETWRDNDLVGGMYGVSIGRVFFGESMFSREADASKVALARAMDFLRAQGYALLDCQVPSSHMTMMGATFLHRDRFLDLLAELCVPPGSPGSWSDAMGVR
jgi:leucyl/phenylalanyl-tRNA--protein transferase